MAKTNAANSVEGQRGRRSVVDTVLIGVVCAWGAVATAFLLLVPKLYIPAEDSVILFQFSRNLATTGAITYNAYGPHAEGATDFGWMALIAAGMKLHIDPYWLVSAVNVVSLLLLAAMLIKIAGQRITAISIFFILGCFCFTPQYAASLQAFSTLPFACLLVLVVWTFLRRNDALTALAAWFLCMLRPDGIVFAVPILAAALWLYPGRARRVAMDAALFVIPGLTYFLWRWHYFGHFLPLPFMVKSDTPRLAHLFVADSIFGCVIWMLFALPVLAVALRGHWRDVGNRAVLVSVLGVPSLFYMMMRLDQNVGERFFMYFPVGIALLIAMNWQNPTIRQTWVLRVSFIAWLLLIFPRAARHDNASWGGQLTTRKAIAQDLTALPHGTLLTTEAGVVPYYSHWQSYDAWGLSTAQFADHLIQPAEVAGLRPDILLMHTGGGGLDCVAQKDRQTPYAIRTWDHLTRNLAAGADPAHYDLWILPLGNLRLINVNSTEALRGEHECWFVRRNGSQRPAIEDVLRRHGGLPEADFTAEVQAADTAAIVDIRPPTARQRFISQLRKLWRAWP